MMVSKFFSKNVIVSALISVVLFFVITNIFYYYFNAQSMFKELHYYEWVEYIFGTIAMGVCTFIVEGIRNVLRNDA